jgi:redox-sensitive bicupin YhaK (pirin superfamily)
MLHSEWNHGDTDTRAYILVYSTDPVPEETAFNVLKDADAPRYEEGDGVHTKELVGPKSPLRVNGDIRLFTDSELDPGAKPTVDLEPGEGAVLSVREGEVRIDGGRLVPGSTLIAPAAEDRRSLHLVAERPARLVRVVHGPGHGFVTAPAPREKR